MPNVGRGLDAERGCITCGRLGRRVVFVKCEGNGVVVSCMLGV
jgi:hypothetical protein